MPNKKTFIIIDGHAIIHRAYHALPPLTVKDGTMVNAVFGFSSMLLKVITEFSPTYLAVSFDVGGGTFRDEIYEEYKATREKADQELYDQIPLVYDVVNAFNIPIYEQKGFEADDVIGTLAKTIKQKNKDIQTIIVTGDQDLLQLVDDNITDVYLLRKGVSDFTLFNEKAVKEKFGFGPEHIVDYKALKGDSSDNIPGVRGIGDKTAKELIHSLGTIENIYKELEKSSSAKREELKASVIKKLIEGKDNAFMSKDLATIRQDVKKLGFSFQDCITKEFNASDVEELFKKFEFYSLIKRLPGKKYVSETSEKNTTTYTSPTVMVLDGASLSSFIEIVKKGTQFVVREVLGGTDVLTSPLVGFVFATQKHTYSVDIQQLSKDENNQLFSLFTQPNITLVGHELKQLVKVLSLRNIIVKNKLFDCKIASYITNASTRAHELRSIVLRELGIDLPEQSTQQSLFGQDRQFIANEIYFLQEIKERYQVQLKEQQCEDVFWNIEMPLIPVLATMEINGIFVDTALLSELSVTAEKTIQRIQKKIWEEAGKEFNVSSSQQLRDILFETLDLPTTGIKKGKTGYSTAASELEKLKGLHPIITLIEQFRETEKLRNTYIDVLPKLIHPATKRIHTSFNQTVAATGRLSSSDPNMQNIPIRTKLGRQVRDAFIAEPGHTLVAADYSQIELRIVAALAKDATMQDIFAKGKDIHTATAAAINGIPLEEVTKDMRRAAKEVNFGVLYGMGPFGLAARTGISQWQAKEFIQKYFENFSSVKTYLENTLKQAKKTGYVETYFGRRRNIPELSASNHQVKNAGERMAINMPVQGTAADIMKIAMVAVQEWITKTYKHDEVKLLLQVHDELVLEVQKGKEQEVAKKVEEIMEHVVTFDVPIEVDTNTGKRWGKLK